MITIHHEICPTSWLTLKCLCSEKSEVRVFCCPCENLEDISVKCNKDLRFASQLSIRLLYRKCYTTHGQSQSNKLLKGNQFCPDSKKFSLADHLIIKFFHFFQIHIYYLSSAPSLQSFSSLYWVKLLKAIVSTHYCVWAVCYTEWFWTSHHWPITVMLLLLFMSGRV